MSAMTRFHREHIFPPAAAAILVATSVVRSVAKISDWIPVEELLLPTPALLPRHHHARYFFDFRLMAALAVSNTSSTNV